jgi:hypothetical protein
MGALAAPALQKWPRGASMLSSPNEGGPAILEVVVPAWIMAILYADPIAAGLARSGKIRFEPESGLMELRSEWHKLTKRVIPL